MVRPDCAMARVSATRSPMSMPRKNTAMAKAAICPSEIEPSLRPRTKNAISASPSAPPSRFRRMISWGRNKFCGADAKAHSVGSWKTRARKRPKSRSDCRRTASSRPIG